MDKPPRERAKLHFLLGWFHAVILERKKYLPMGWSKSYEFNESDLICAARLIDTLLDAKSLSRTSSNIPVEKIPFIPI